MPIEKEIKIVKLDCEDACGWGIHDGVIRVEVSKGDWEALEKIAARTTRSMDFIIAESVLSLFTEGS